MYYIVSPVELTLTLRLPVDRPQCRRCYFNLDLSAIGRFTILFDRLSVGYLQGYLWTDIRLMEVTLTLTFLSEVSLLYC